jgi:hypothetical protein
MVHFLLEVQEIAFLLHGKRRFQDQRPFHSLINISLSVLETHKVCRGAWRMAILIVSVLLATACREFLLLLK